MYNPFHAAPVTEFSSEDMIQNDFLAGMQGDYLDEICDFGLPEIESPGILDREIQILDDWELQDSYNYYNSCNYGTNLAEIDF